ncbi:DUF937 domain-containing protein [Rhodocaloribacter litoris]|uniref:DUF937 domain-containing protein n=1 Tax=Rhodocaloribacter litoris TaxID=2558931 RepID=UPI00141FD845|nr:DUF937 domain-containing protein [Rhodocaloribacter litoris]QXD17046.1 DUF937 domain-containing protein [Rhodocaloribacter litoris]
MEALKNQILSALGGQVTEILGRQFGLPQEKAAQVLPAVTPPVLTSLQEALQNPQEHLGLLQALASQFLNDREDVPSQGLAGLAGQVLGDRFGGVASALSRHLGLDASKAQGILETVVPMVLNFIGTRAHQAEGNDLEALARMLGVSGGGLLGSLTKGSDAGSLLGGAGSLLGGLFGKK